MLCSLCLGYSAFEVQRKRSNGNFLRTNMMELRKKLKKPRKVDRIIQTEEHFQCHCNAAFQA
ncbi:hypothetical protein Ciccas_007029 [Cichlidogyrus casuarinus]|uniref:Uncharacterized protein n=1 Tax=Cichlidogyrus casuarinus TaxID=1844966 RepID=A0ABD2Q4B0_9PLAT